MSALYLSRFEVVVVLLDLVDFSLGDALIELVEEALAILLLLLSRIIAFFSVIICISSLICDYGNFWMVSSTFGTT